MTSIAHRPLALALAAGGSFLAGCGAGGPTSTTAQAARVTANVAYYHATFAAGPSLITDSDGAIVDERRHEPFGAAIDADYALDPHNALNKETDSRTGWSDHGARWLAPDTARWLTPDPPVKAPDPKFMAAPWALHPYQYVEQNPIAYWDPDGREPKELPNTPPARHEAPHTAPHSAGDDAMHSMHSAMALLHVGSYYALHNLPGATLAIHELEKGTRVMSGGLAVYHFVAWIGSESGTRENSEHAGAFVTNAILLLAPPPLAAALAFAEIFIPGFNEYVGRALSYDAFKAEAYRQGKLWRDVAEAERKVDFLLEQQDRELKSPVYGPEPPPPVYGPEPPPNVSRPDDGPD
jgi:RHS repeat-associated protein